METTKPKPHPHADLIKAWVDGAHIQYFDEKRNVWDDCLLNAPTWGKDIKYRIKPEETSNEPWKPKLKDKYFILDLFAGEIRVKYYIWYDTTVDNALYRNHNCFRTEEEAEAAIPRVIDSLKGNDSLGSKKSLQLQLDVKDAEIKAIKKQLEEKEQRIANQTVVDGKPLSDGEVALIKAMRKVWIKEIPKYGHSVLVYNKEGSMQMTPANLCVAFITDGLISGIGTEDAIIEALKQIKKEQKLLK